MTDQPRNTPQFFLTAPTTCPYLPGKEERKVFTHLVGKRAIELNEILTQGGFRRSQSIAYRPACETCRACVSVRVLVDEFRPSRRFRRNLALNADISGRFAPNRPDHGHFDLFRSYLETRHADGGMADMNALDFANMVEDSHVETRLVEYRLGNQSRNSGALVATALTDILSDGISMVYSFYDPDFEKRSLGTYMILDHIEKARILKLPYLYLGYWVEGSRKMAYKGQFLPQERLEMSGWTRVEG